MKTLLISTCHHALNDREFVFPISKILGDNRHDIMHFENCSREILSSYSRIIICGTSMQDSTYIDWLPFFEEMLENFTGPVLGICSGMQILTSVFGSSSIADNLEIGMIEVKTLEQNELFEGNFQAYSLHNFSSGVCDNFNILAESKEGIQAVKHVEKPLYGISFHPEVRNEQIVTNFLIT
ncbi:hypothetical protein OAK07_00375 [Marine Group III euryarchaeote]|nr:hypothetical protein [Marine Group III euryarchaeote]